MLPLLAYLAGVLTIVSPCILPVLPFVLSRADGRFVRTGLPLLGGMALTFAAVASLAAVAGSWAVAVHQHGRTVAMVLLAIFGLLLLLPRVAARVTRPLVVVGDRLSRRVTQDGEPGVLGSVVLGAATGLLWVPCAGPVLGLILTGAALQGANARTSLLLLAYGAGAATSLGLVLVTGGQVLAALRRSLPTGDWVRRGLGAAVLASVAAIALGVDTGLLTRLSAAGTTTLEQGLMDRLGVDPATATGPAMAGPSMVGPSMTGPSMTGPSMTGPAMTGDGAAGTPVIQGMMPSLDGATTWLGSAPLTAEDLRGKVVLVDFWTYSCINCLRTLPYVRAWAEKYADDGLVVIGVHTPEFAFEKRLDNVTRAVADLGIDYPVAVDNDYAIWRAFQNRYWPAHYFVDAEGRIRHHRFGEGDHETSERVLQQLLAEAGRAAGDDLVAIAPDGVAAAADLANVRSPETYLGHRRAAGFASPGGMVHDAPHAYTVGSLQGDQWALDGTWTVGEEAAQLDEPGGRIVTRFHARDLHLVLGPGPDGAPVRFRVTLDGEPPGEDAGLDVAADGTGVITEQRLHQLVRQTGPITDRTFSIELLDPGAEAYAFTFG